MTKFSMTGSGNISGGGKKSKKKTSQSKSSSGTGLNKKEVKQTKQIVKKTVNAMAESKYFECKDLLITKSLNRARNNCNGIGVLGFATLEDKNSQGTRLVYGVDTTNAYEYLTELNMNRASDKSDTNEFRKAQAVVGNYVNASFAQSTFVLERDYIQTSGAASDYSVLAAAPYYVRILRLAPRAPKMSTEDVNPMSDAFVNEKGEPAGIDDNDFGPVELMTFKANGRKYKIISDKSFTMVPPFTVNNQATGQAAPADTANASVSNLTANGCFKTIQMKHDIGKKLYFPHGGQGRHNSSTGQKNEFILFHTCQVGVNSADSINANIATNMLVSGKFVSTFKDI